MSKYSNAIYVRATSHYSTVMFDFHVHTEMPFYGYCLEKIGELAEEGSEGRKYLVLVMHNKCSA